MVTACQSACVGRNSNVENTLVRVGPKHGIMTIYSRPDQLKGTRLRSLRIDGLYPQSSMESTVKETSVVGNLEFFLDMQSAVPVCCNLRIKSRDSIRSLCSGDS